MDTEQEQFDQVRKLLALKKYEQPPPRYFQDFSSKVIARLQALEAARRVTWRQRLGLDFDFKPAIVGAFGVVVCGLLLVGILTSQGESQSPNVVLGSDSSGLLASPTANPILAGGAGLQPIFRPDEIPDSTVPVGNDTSSHSPFGVRLKAQPAGFTSGTQ